MQDFRMCVVLARPLPSQLASAALHCTANRACCSAALHCTANRACCSSQCKSLVSDQYGVVGPQPCGVVALVTLVQSMQKARIGETSLSEVRGHRADETSAQDRITGASLVACAPALNLLVRCRLLWIKGGLSWAQQATSFSHTNRSPFALPSSPVRNVGAHGAAECSGRRRPDVGRVSGVG